MAIHVCQSHNIEILMESMLRASNSPSDNLFEVLETRNFIVPNRAVEKWLTQEVAKKSGISGNFKFYPRIQAFQWAAYQFVLPNKEFVRQANLPIIIIKWRIYEALKSFIEPAELLMHPSHELFPIIERIYQSANHLSNSKEAIQQKQKMLYWVADQVSRLFTNYMSYRGQCHIHGYGECDCAGHWLSQWGRNKPLNVKRLLNMFNEVTDEDPELIQAKQLESWQRWLWVNVFHQDFLKIAEVDRQFWDALDNPDTRDEAISKLPRDLTVFTILELPPQQLNFLRRLGQYIDVVIYHYNPSQEYWADSVDSRWKKQYDLGIKERFIEQSRLRGKTVTDHEINEFFQDFSANFNAETRDSRHPLLTRLGKQARDHFSLLSHLSSGDEGMWFDLFHGEFKPTVLGQLQSDILNLLEPEPNAYELQQGDESIRFNVCHSSLRQLETLKDDMLRWLAAGTPDDPRSLDDILVLTPNIKNLEPLIRSVFSPLPKKGSSGTYLPVKITGVPQVTVVNAWNSVLGRLQLTQGRFQFEEFADWLSLSATQMLYGLDYPMVERMLELLKTAGFSRSFDDAHFAEQLNTADGDFRFSFKYAIDRLMLGVAIDEQIQFSGVLSTPQLNTEDFELIGKLIAVYEDLNERRDLLSDQNSSRSSEMWFKYLMSEVRQYQEQGVQSLNDVYEVIQSLIRPLQLQALQDYRAQMGQASLVDMSLPLSYLIEEVTNGINSRLDAAEPSGQITFSQIGHIRPLPYKLVVMLNMDSGVFPGQQSRIPFDLMGILPPSLGDRSRLDDEHGSFLDGMLLAKDCFWVYFNGFDIDSGLPRQPSSVVQELIDHLAVICSNGTNVPGIEYTKLNEMEIQRHLVPLFVMHQLQPFDAKGFTPEANRFKNQWFKVAHKIQNPMGEASPWSNIVYTTERQAAQIRAAQWINQMVFPADLYLRSISVRNVKAQDMMPEFEPLIVNGLEKYEIREQLHNNSPAQEEISNLLPVGKLKDVMWKYANAEYQQCVARQSALCEKPIAEQVVHHTISSDLSLLIAVPELGTKHWVKIRPSSAYGDHRTKIWIEYLLWLSHLNLGDEGTEYRMSVVFIDETIECSGMTTNEARAALDKWYQAWKYGQSQPLVLPAKLIMSRLEKGKELTWDFCEDSKQWQLNEIDEILKTWNETFEYSDDYKFTENKANKKHRDWSFILRNQNAAEALKQACSQFSYDLYHPICRYQKIV